MLEIRCAIEYREDESRESPGLLVGTLLKYGEISPGHRERFMDGSLTGNWPKAGILVNLQHDRRQPLLRTVPVVEGREIRIKAPFLNTRAGRDSASARSLGRTHWAVCGVRRSPGANERRHSRDP